MSSKKVLLLGILLLVPILIYLFLKVFGSNRYELRTFYPVINEDTEEPLILKGDTVFYKIPDFSLISQSGDPISQRQLDGSVYVANFIFASCKDICKKMSTQMTRVQEAFRNEPALKLVSHTIDPARDTIAVLKQYADFYRADPTKWYFLTGPKTEIYTLARDHYKVAAVEAPTVLPDFIHSEKFILVDINKHVRGIYDGTSPEDVDRLITEIKVLIQEQKPHANK